MFLVHNTKIPYVCVKKIIVEEWALNEIEAFVISKIQGQGVSSVEEASKQEWQAPYDTNQNMST